MAKTTDGRRAVRHYSHTSLWIGLTVTTLLFGFFLEFVCLGILYFDASKNAGETTSFVKTHLLTKLFASATTNPIPGKDFLGTFPTDDGQSAQFLIADDLLGWRLRANVSYFYAPAPPRRYLYITDDNGFIADKDDPPITLQKPANTYRVIVLGGSTVMGNGAPRPSQNIVGALAKDVRERRLTGPKGERVEFINAGVLGYNSAQEYLYFVSDLLRFRPDLVVAYDGWNDSEYDLNDNISPLRTQSHLKLQARIDKSYTIAGSLFLLAQNLKDFLTSGDFKLGLFELPWRIVNNRISNADSVHAPSIPFDSRSIEFYDMNRRAFLALANNQLSVALFLQPLVGTDDRILSAEEKASWWYPRLAEILGRRVPFYEHARQVLAELKAQKSGSHLCVADLSHSLSGVTEPVYADTGHLLPNGNEIVAAHILDQFVLCGFLR